MGKKWWILLLMLTGVVVIVALAFRGLTRGEGPVYQGRSLASWIRQLPAKGSDDRGVGWAPLVSGGETRAELEAEAAVRHIGTNALPYLLAEMHNDKNGLREEVDHRWTQFKAVTQRLITRKPVIQSFTSGMEPKSTAERRHWNAARGFYALGLLAKPAIPELAKLLANNVASADAAYALSGMGADGLVPLKAAMTNNSALGDWPQICVIWALGQSPTNGAAALPELLACLHDKNAAVRMGAVWTLGQIQSNPELIAPALATSLGDTDFNARSMAEQALKKYGLTRTSVPALTNYLNDPKLTVRMAATNALRALYPDEAARAGMK